MSILSEHNFFALRRSGPHRAGFSHAFDANARAEETGERSATRQLYQPGLLYVYSIVSGGEMELANSSRVKSGEPSAGAGRDGRAWLLRH